MSDLATLFFANATIVMVLLAWYTWHVNRLAHANRSLTAFCLLLALGSSGLKQASAA